MPLVLRSRNSEFARSSIDPEITDGAVSGQGDALVLQGLGNRLKYTDRRTTIVDFVDTRRFAAFSDTKSIRSNSMP